MRPVPDRESNRKDQEQPTASEFSGELDVEDLASLPEQQCDLIVGGRGLEGGSFSKSSASSTYQYHFVASKHTGELPE